MPVYHTTPQPSLAELATDEPGADRDRLADAALAYAAHGWPVFPLRPQDKVPLIGKAKGGRGCHDATTDPGQLAAWWTRWPKANIGLAAGDAFVVLDVDGEEGLATLADLEDLNRWLAIGPASVTGSGGEHLLFAANARVRNSVKRLGPGLDTRAAGGYIVAPPSIHPNGARYAWIEGRDPWSVPLPEAPGWLLELLDPPRPAYRPFHRPRRPTTRYIATDMQRELEAVVMADQGQRNQTLNRAAFKLGRLVAKGDLDACDVGEALVGAALATGLNEREAVRTVTSGLRAAIQGQP